MGYWGGAGIEFPEIWLPLDFPFFPWDHRDPPPFPGGICGFLRGFIRVFAACSRLFCPLVAAEGREGAAPSRGFPVFLGEIKNLKN